jgi:hypothetical protein
MVQQHQLPMLFAKGVFIQTPFPVTLTSVPGSESSSSQQTVAAGASAQTRTYGNSNISAASRLLMRDSNPPL